MYLRNLLFIIFMFLVPIISNATEQNDIGWYVGGSIGRVITTAETTNVFTQNESAGSLGAYGGYNFNKWFSLEGMLFFTGDVANNRADLDKANFLSLMMTPKFTHRLSPGFSLYAKGGLAFLAYGERYNTYSYPRGTRESWGGTGLTYGVGAQFDMSDKIKLRVGYDHIKGTLEYNEIIYVSKPADVEAKLENISIGLHYQF